MVDDESWKEFMPDGVSKDRFKEFTKYYDKDIFVSACRRIRAISKNADELEPTERIKELIILFNKFKNPDKETVLTPWNVVNLHLSETIGGYDFFDDAHQKDKMLDEPRFVSQKLTTSEIFGDKSKVLEINSKTGLYPLYIAYTFYRKKLDKIPVNEQTFDKKIEIWDDVVKNNVYVICKTTMAKLITKRTLVGYRNCKINSHAFDDLIMQLKDKPEKFVDKITNESFWKKGGNQDMKFNAVVGNPPYQGTNHSQIYPYFYLTSILLGENVSLIFPVGWQQPKNANNLQKLNNPSVKEDKQIVFIDNRQNVFPGISGAEWTNIILWKKGFDNCLGGKQLVYTNGLNPKEFHLEFKEEEAPKPKEIVELGKIIRSDENFVPMQSITSTSKPYGIRKDIFNEYEKYHLPKMNNARLSENDILVYGSFGNIRYVSEDYPFPKVSKSLMKYKVLVGSAWGNMSERSGLGGSFADIIIAFPRQACTETFQESGCFDDYDTAKKHAKYLMTKFARACLYVNKLSQMSTQAWGSVPIQNYHEPWWNKSIVDLDEELFNKYNVPEKIRSFIRSNFQTRTEHNIVNYYNKNDVLECSDNNSSAQGHFDDKGFIVLKGSIISDHTVPSFEKYDPSTFELRKKCESDGTIVNKILTKDMEFSSLSSASAFVTGHIANGSEWKIKS